MTSGPIISKSAKVTRPKQERTNSSKRFFKNPSLNADLIIKKLIGI
jgi:hypothetical protein